MLNILVRIMMRKIALLSFVVFFFVLASMSTTFALPLFGDPVDGNVSAVFTVEGYEFTVHNKSDSTDSYNATYYG